MISSPFVSYAQNGEDVVLWRALGGVSDGRYVEVGANHPRDDSVTRAFYERGWSGITIEPVPYFADLHRAERPRDHLVQAAVTNSDRGQITLHVVPGTGLSTVVDAVSDRQTRAGIERLDLLVPTLRLDDVLAESGWTSEDIHFMVIDVEGAESDVLQSVDLNRWRPWVLVVEATAPNSTATTHGAWEPQLLARGYEYCLFDGISRFYVAVERADSLRNPLSYPACVLDNYQTLSLVTALRERQELLAQAEDYRTTAQRERQELLAQAEDYRTTAQRERQELLAEAEDCRTSALRERGELLQQTAHWRTIALTRWADAVSKAPGTPRGAGADAEVEQARMQLAAMQNTLSWRITRPLRGARRVIDLARRR